MCPVPHNVKKCVTDHPLHDIMDVYQGLSIGRVRQDLSRHWDFAGELLEAISRRARDRGLV